MLSSRNDRQTDHPLINYDVLIGMIKPQNNGWSIITASFGKCVKIYCWPTLICLSSFWAIQYCRTKKKDHYKLKVDLHLLMMLLLLLNCWCKRRTISPERGLSDLEQSYRTQKSTHRHREGYIYAHNNNNRPMKYDEYNTQNKKKRTLKHSNENHNWLIWFYLSSLF